MHYPQTDLFIAGTWRRSASGQTTEVRNPASGEVIGQVAKATAADLDEAIAAACEGFAQWRLVPGFERATILRRAAQLLRERVEAMAPLITMEQGKPLKEARAEIFFAAEVTEWFADEARRTYGRLIPAREPEISAQAVMEPLGVIAGLTPWNYPVGQAVRKIAVALAAGCSIIVKVAEETPAAAAEMVRAFNDAGLPKGALQLVFGDPGMISNHLIGHPDVRGISFTGSTAVGKMLTGLAGQHLKRCVMELGGHAPAIVYGDADLDGAAAALAGDKFHNAGQACIAPTRILVEDHAHARFLDGFVAAAEAVRLGDGFDAASTMGPLANGRRITALTALVEDAVAQGARLVTGGPGGENRGYFFKPTVLADVPMTARIMNEEPFGPVAIINRFTGTDAALAEANRLPYALAAYGYSSDAGHIEAMRRFIRSGMVSINHNGLGYPEVPFGGILDSGFGDEGGIEALREMMYTRFVSVRSVAA
ncbi:NAD-dependent succinate-semialdehyde dehydrogenase [Devosia chinhatensis]|uniref:Aldehyde dehydrogenase n=1 Tax=Devosia chinhatensis TaxID=429727 RepID=A0A0F5FGS7_9HYPH|nr:NAD-dependent succinate-semialdehyde dehydrogenase [Devosia chinhatensis]KKB08036.1 aldehyde dehydrogenase [Devosia chinhatensis]